MRRWGAIARYGPLGSGVGAPGEVNKVDWEHSGGEGWFFPERFEWWHGGFVRKDWFFPCVPKTMLVPTMFAASRRRVPGSGRGYGGGGKADGALGAKGYLAQPATGVTASTA